MSSKKMLRPIRGHGVSGFPVLGRPGDFSYYTPSGYITKTNNVAGSRFGVQARTPDPINSFSAMTHTPTPITTQPNMNVNVTEQRLPVEAGTLPMEQREVVGTGQSYLESRMASGLHADDPVITRLFTPSSAGGGAPPMLTPHTSTHSNTPIQQSARTALPGTQGAVNLWPSSTPIATPATGNATASLAAHTTPQLINTSNAHAGTHPRFAAGHIQSNVGNEMANKIVDALINRIQGPPPIGPSAPIPVRTTGPALPAPTSKQVRWW